MQSSGVLLRIAPLRHFSHVYLHSLTFYSRTLDHRPWERHIRSMSHLLKCNQLICLCSSVCLFDLLVWYNDIDVCKYVAVQQWWTRDFPSVFVIGQCQAGESDLSCLLVYFHLTFRVRQASIFFFSSSLLDWLDVSSLFFQFSLSSFVWSVLFFFFFFFFFCTRDDLRSVFVCARGNLFCCYDIIKNHSEILFSSTSWVSPSSLIF